MKKPIRSGSCGYHEEVLEEELDDEDDDDDDDDDHDVEVIYQK